MRLYFKHIHGYSLVWLDYIWVHANAGGGGEEEGGEGGEGQVITLVTLNLRVLGFKVEPISSHKLSHDPMTWLSSQVKSGMTPLTWLSSQVDLTWVDFTWFLGHFNLFVHL